MTINNLSFALLDDDPLSIYLTREILDHYCNGCEVSSYTDPELFLRSIDDLPTGSVVLVDLNMPSLHGWEVIRKLREKNPKLNISVLSSTIDPSDKEKAHLLEIKFLHKPLDINELKNALRSFQDEEL